MNRKVNPYRSPRGATKPVQGNRRKGAFLDMLVAWCSVVILVWLGLPTLDTSLVVFFPLFVLLLLLCLAIAVYLTIRCFWPSQPAEEETQPSTGLSDGADDESFQ